MFSFESATVHSQVHISLIVWYINGTETCVPSIWVLISSQGCCCQPLNAKPRCAVSTVGVYPSRPCASMSLPLIRSAYSALESCCNQNIKNKTKSSDRLTWSSRSAAKAKLVESDIGHWLKTSLCRRESGSLSSKRPKVLYEADWADCTSRKYQWRWW